ncbi:MAG: hypothetical protein Q9226_007849 [Calogaya cf. arnoldii]
MLPDILFSSYQRYKEDTNVFSTWLSQAARACGFKLANSGRNKAEPSKSSNISETRNQDQQPSSLESDSKQAQENPQTFNDELSNRFHMLKVHDTNLDIDLTATEVQVQEKQTPAKSQTQSQAEREVWELIDEFSTDIAFVIYCFFEDLHRIQDFLKETWTKYKDGTLDLKTCAMMTNLALDLVRRAEEDIISQAPTLLRGPRSYEAISVLIFYAESFKQGNDPEKMLGSDESLKITPFDESIYLSTARILIKFEQISRFKVAYPQPIPSVRMSYLSRPDLLDLAQVKKWEEEDVYISQLLMDMSLHDTTSKAMKEFNKDGKAPAVDELTNGLYRLRREGEVSTWIVFAARVLLDIRDIMGKDMSRGHQKQVAAGHAAIETLDMYVDGNGALTPRGLRWTGKDGPHIMSLYRMLQHYSINDFFPMLKQRWLAEKAHIVDSYQSFNQLPPEWREKVTNIASPRESKPDRHPKWPVT